MINIYKFYFLYLVPDLTYLETLSSVFDLDREWISTFSRLKILSDQKSCLYTVTIGVCKTVR